MPASTETAITRDDIEKLIDRRPIQALEKARDRLKDLGIDDPEILYPLLQSVVEITRAIDNSYGLRRALIEHEIWNACPEKPAANAGFRELLRWTCRFLFSSTSTEGPRYNRASEYWHALLAYHEAGVDVQDIAKRLREDYGVDAVPLSSDQAAVA